MRQPARIVICGGGVAALEALLALRELLDVGAQIELLAPNRRFVYRPMAVAEPFGLARTELFDLAAIASRLGARLHVGRLAAVETDAHELVLDDGSRLSYDAALIAVGARSVNWLAGSCSFGGQGGDCFNEVLERLEQGASSSVAFVCPAGASWTLPIYELALLTASQEAERGIADVELTIITPELQPLGLFGPGAVKVMRGLLSDRGVGIRAGERVQRFHAGRLALDSGDTLAVDEVVALARLDGPRVPGLPSDGDGFIPIDDHCEVPGAPGVYAAGDGTSFPIKQGGLATQQADVAAEAIAARLGAALPASSFEPVLRAMLLTGIAPVYLRARLAGSDVAVSDVDLAVNALWSPATKVAGRHLAPFLADAPAFEHESLHDQAPSALDAETSRRGHEEARELALLFAEADARSGDLHSALSWLTVVERIDGVLPSGYTEKRDAWREQLRPQPEAVLSGGGANTP